MNRDCILVPIDFSDFSKRALTYAVGISKVMGFKIIVLHSQDEEITPNINCPPEEYIRRSEEKKDLVKIKTMNEWIEPYLSDTYDDNTPLEIEPIIDHREPLTGILAYEASHSIRLIVMGTKGRTGIEKLFMSNLTEKVLEKTACPVITVPRKAEFKGIKKIVYATDFDLDDVLILEDLEHIVSKFEAHIECVHVQTSGGDDDHEKEKLIFAPMSKIDFKILRNNSVNRGLNEYLQNSSTDLLVMSIHRKPFFERLFKKSKSLEMNLHSTVPILNIIIKN